MNEDSVEASSDERKKKKIRVKKIPAVTLLLNEVGIACDK